MRQVSTNRHVKAWAKTSRGRNSPIMPSSVLSRSFDMRNSMNAVSRGGGGATSAASAAEGVGSRESRVEIRLSTSSSSAESSCAADGWWRGAAAFFLLTASSSSASAADGSPRSFDASPTMLALKTADGHAAIVARTAFETRATASIDDGSASFARSTRHWKDIIDSPFSKSARNCPAPFVLRNESGSSPSGRETTRTGISAASSMPAERMVALWPAASSS